MHFNVSSTVFKGKDEIVQRIQGLAWELFPLHKFKIQKKQKYFNTFKISAQILFSKQKLQQALKELEFLRKTSNSSGFPVFICHSLKMLLIVELGSGNNGRFHHKAKDGLLGLAPISHLTIYLRFSFTICKMVLRPTLIAL